MFLKEIGIHAQNKIIILDLTINIGGGGQRDLYDHLMVMIIFTLIMNNIFIQASKI